jgi:endonuclease/exonuclease/phosphatase family metal-dependent hydrolase
MKLITLNAWGGKLYEPLIQFIKDNKDVDIFCFQDVLFGNEPMFSPIEKGRLNLFSEISNVLKDYEYVISREPGHSWVGSEILSEDIGAGKVIFVRKKFKIVRSGEFDVCDVSFKDQVIVSSACQWIEIEKNGEIITILNLHGLWQRDSKKKDTAERLEQSRRIRNFLSTVSGKKIFCGDFNMIPDGESIKILEEGMRNLIKEYSITSTRSKHYPKEEKFADYILVSNDIKVDNFKALPHEVSDHLALYLDFE